MMLKIGLAVLALMSMAVLTTGQNCSTITEIACGTEGFEILCEVIDSSGLGDDLDTDTWTVFAPTNDAFESLPPFAIPMLMNDTATLTDLLLFHTVSGMVVESTDLVCDDLVEMSNGDFTTVSCLESDVYIVGEGNPPPGPRIIATDILACNGMIHAINQVLLFENVTSPTDAPTPSFVLTSEPSASPTVAPVTPETSEPVESFAPSSAGTSPSPTTSSPTSSPTSATIAPTASPPISPTTSAPVIPVSETNSPTASPPISPPISAPVESIAPSSAGTSPSPTTSSPTSGPTPGTVAPTASPPISPPISAPVTPVPTVTSETTSPTIPGTVGCTIVDVVCSTEETSTLCELVKIAGLDSALSQGTFTVFAPVNSAFDKLGDVAVASLSEPENKGVLENILLFHAVPDVSLRSEDLECTELVLMANGYESRTVCRDSKIYQKGAGNSDDERPEIIGTDIETCNGMIHTLNSVMLHKTAEQLGLPPSGATFGPTVQPVPTVPPVSQPPTQCETLDEVICNDDQFAALCERLTSTGLLGALKTGMWTVFAPISKGFVDLAKKHSREFLEDLDADLQELSNILLFHVVPDKVIYKKDLPCVAGQNLIEMANSKDSRTLCMDITPGVPEPMYQKGNGNPDDDKPNFLAFDKQACNGVLHVIDQVLLFKSVDYLL